MSANDTIPAGSSPPAAKIAPAHTTHHGVTLQDDYAWLRADNWQDVMRDPGLLDEDIRAYLEQENAYTKSCMADTEALQQTLFQEMKGRIKEDDSSVPSPDGDFAYFSRFVTGRQYPQLCRCDRACERKEDPDVLLDGNAEAEGKAYWQLGDGTHSPDHKLLAYSFDDKGSELYTIRVRDLATNETLLDTIPGTHGDIVWANDGKTFFYIKLDDNHRPLMVYRHVVGTPAESDVLVYKEQDHAFYVGLDQTQSRKYITINVHDHQTSEIHLIDADNPSEPTRLVAAREAGHEYGVEHSGERLLITTNCDGAEDFKIVEAPVSAPGRENWTDVVSHKPGRLILDTIAYRDHLACLEREDSLPRIVIRRFSDGQSHEISFDEEAYGLGLSSGYEFDTPMTRFSYSSMTTPAEIYDYDMNSRERTLRKRQVVPSGHEPKDYRTRRIYVTAADGETVPVSILHHKNTSIDGSAPLFLYGYGAYGISIPASFSTARLSLVDRGFIYAIAHVRGGKDKGYRWYTNGKLDKKTNTFTDFIAAGDALAQQGFTSRGRIVANGGSAGGMLMGAVANMAPDLFLGIIADVPFVDVLNTMLDKDLPLTPPEWLEWGNPLASEQEFNSIRSYSPYDNVEAKDYPHILACGGLTDPRVTYWEPAKWVARLRKLNTSDNLLLLKTNMEAGHGGASGRFEQLKEVALNYAFALKVAGLAT